jgi:hypothetical protein
MGLFDRFSDAIDSGNREKKGKFNKGRDLYYHNPTGGIKLMEENCRTADDFRVTAAKQWEKIKEEKGRAAADKDPDYQRLKELQARAPY